MEFHQHDNSVFVSSLRLHGKRANSCYKLKTVFFHFVVFAHIPLTCTYLYLSLPLLSIVNRIVCPPIITNFPHDFPLFHLSFWLYRHFIDFSQHARTVSFYSLSSFRPCSTILNFYNSVFNLARILIKDRQSKFKCTVYALKRVLGVWSMKIKIGRKMNKIIIIRKLNLWI